MESNSDVYRPSIFPDGTTSHQIPSGYLNPNVTYNWKVFAGDGQGNHAALHNKYFTTASTASSLSSFNAINESNSSAVSPLNTNPSIMNCTIVDNSASNNGGGIYSIRSFPTVTNSILWGNTAHTSGNETYVDDGGSIAITYSDIQGGYDGAGNINDDPLFVGGGDYHLKPGSPCIDKGTGSGAPAEDIEGTSRPLGSGYDMGAYETQSPGCPHDGDVNQSGGITPQDALMAFQHYLGIITLEDCQQDRADVTGGGITPADALCIFQKYLGLPSCLD